jgi:hypothetical protein
MTVVASLDPRPIIDSPSRRSSRDRSSQQGRHRNALTNDGSWKERRERRPPEVIKFCLVSFFLWWPIVISTRFLLLLLLGRQEMDRIAAPGLFFNGRNNNQSAQTPVLDTLVAAERPWVFRVLSSSSTRCRSRPLVGGFRRVRTKPELAGTWSSLAPPPAARIISSPFV